MEITLRIYDLYIAEIKDQDNKSREVVRLKAGLAFDEQFIEDLKAKGVKKFVEQE